MAEQGIETPNCPVCGERMEKKAAEKQALAEPYLGRPVMDYECKKCGHVEGHHQV